MCPNIRSDAFYAKLVETRGNNPIKLYILYIYHMEFRERNPYCGFSAYELSPLSLTELS